MPKRYIPRALSNVYYFAFTTNKHTHTCPTIYLRPTHKHIYCTCGKRRRRRTRGAQSNLTPDDIISNSRKEWRKNASRSSRLARSLPNSPHTHTLTHDRKQSQTSSHYSHAYTQRTASPIALPQHTHEHWHAKASTASRRARARSFACVRESVRNIIWKFFQSTRDSSVAITFPIYKTIYMWSCVCVHIEHTRTHAHPHTLAQRHSYIVVWLRLCAVSVSVYLRLVRSHASHVSIHLIVPRPAAAAAFRMCGSVRHCPLGDDVTWVRNVRMIVWPTHAERKIFEWRVIDHLARVKVCSRCFSSNLKWNCVHFIPSIDYF